jgi:hypothetical protein
MVSTLSGVVSNLQFSSETSGQVHGSQGRVTGSMHTKQVVTFRVDGRAAQIKLLGQPSINDGDVVVITGKEKNGTFHARAMRNETTGAIDHRPANPSIILGGLFLVIGLPLSMIIIGLPFVGLGAYNIYDGLQTRQAIAAARTAPKAIRAATA